MVLDTQSTGRLGEFLARGVFWLCWLVVGMLSREKLPVFVRARREKKGLPMR